MIEKNLKMYKLATKKQREWVEQLLTKNGVAPTNYREDTNCNCGGFDYTVISFSSLAQLLKAKELLK